MKTKFRFRRGGSDSSNSGEGSGLRALGRFSAYPRGGALATRNGPCAASRTSERGSALLIVLGFLSFMMISAVSFAVYMRIERQASSNYRHATTARHLLNVGFCRAIDEIDAALGDTKFPDWDGRVRVSQPVQVGTNTSSARVLSLEALSFIPGIFVNDVRKYALEAQWRPINMGAGNVQIGRYAYACVNLSDMLDVNLCKAASRDSSTNRVSIGHLFDSDASRAAFDAAYKNIDRHYDTVQDFYACLYSRRKDIDVKKISTPLADTPFGSAYHSFIEKQDDEFFDWASSHILCTDSIVKPDPPKENVAPCNLLTTQPVEAGILTQPHPAPNAILFKPEFEAALMGATGMTEGQRTMMATMIADYIDEDSIPKQLNMPSVERVPMISQVLVPTFIAPTVTMTSVGVAPDAKEIYSLNLVNPEAPTTLDVELVWPFKNQKDRAPQRSFTVDLEAYFHVVDAAQPVLPQLKSISPYKITATKPAPDFWAKDTSVPGGCYDKATVSFVIPQNFKIPLIDSKRSQNYVVAAGRPITIAEGQKLSVVLVVFASVKQGAEYVDRVPTFLPTYPNLEMAWQEEYAVTPKLFFQSRPFMVQLPFASIDMTPNLIKYDWSSLEVPDPRFNYKAANWIKNTVDVNTIAPKINPATEALLGQEGRDGDIYMAVSDVGVLQSPGELGFIVRPFPQSSRGQEVDFRDQDTVDKSEDKAHMFRTIRLYDHGQAHPRDNIYDYFTARNPDGTLPGARVNPLSDLPQVLAAAVEGTPVDYYWAGAQLAAGGAPADATLRAYVFNKVLGQPSWAAFTNGWSKSLQNIAGPASDLNKNSGASLSDVYGSGDKMQWYSADKLRTAILGETLAEPLQEIDRKMLYAFSLESFSARQQLFLYFLRAEVTVPFFGGTADTGVRSLAGGRALALVWRDPYPATATLVPGYRQHRVLYFKQMDN